MRFLFSTSSAFGLVCAAIAFFSLFSCCSADLTSSLHVTQSSLSTLGGGGGQRTQLDPETVNVFAELSQAEEEARLAKAESRSVFPIKDSNFLPWRCPWSSSTRTSCPENVYGDTRRCIEELRKSEILTRRLQAHWYSSHLPACVRVMRCTDIAYAAKPKRRRRSKSRCLRRGRRRRRSVLSLSLSVSCSVSVFFTPHRKFPHHTFVRIRVKVLVLTQHFAGTGARRSNQGHRGGGGAGK